MRRLILAALLAITTPAQAFPERPLTLVVPFAPGGTIDVLARVLAPELAAALGQPVAIDTRPGAGGNLGAAFVAQQSRPDGHTILFTGAGLASSVSLSNLSFDPVRDLTPVLGMGAIPSLLVVSPQSPYRDVAAILAAARAGAGRVSYGSSGPGTGSHLAGVQQGAVRALGITSRTRSDVLPDVPAIAETVPGYAFETWVGLFIRAGAPDATQRRLEAAALTALQAPAVRERLRLSAAQPIPAESAAFAAYFREDVARWAEMVRQGRLQRTE